jgi:hypothetical protein
VRLEEMRLEGMRIGHGQSVGCLSQSLVQLQVLLMYSLLLGFVERLVLLQGKANIHGAIMEDYLHEQSQMEE